MVTRDVVKRLIGLGLAVGLVALALTFDASMVADPGRIDAAGNPVSDNSNWFGVVESEYEVVVAHCEDLILRIEGTWGETYSNEVGYSLWAILNAEQIRAFCDKHADSPDADLRVALDTIQAQAKDHVKKNPTGEPALGAPNVKAPASGEDEAPPSSAEPRQDAPTDD